MTGTSGSSAILVARKISWQASARRPSSALNRSILMPPANRTRPHPATEYRPAAPPVR